jgi:hypothetical protein
MKDDILIIIMVFWSGNFWIRQNIDLEGCKHYFCRFSSTADSMDLFKKFPTGSVKVF